MPLPTLPPPRPHIYNQLQLRLFDNNLYVPSFRHLTLLSPNSLRINVLKKIPQPKHLVKFLTCHFGYKMYILCNPGSSIYREILGHMNKPHYMD